MGTLRFALAVVVALSHTGTVFWGYNTGVVAVVSFFMISGYVMALLIERHYNSIDRVGYFYLDRAARLFPQFWLYCLCGAALLWWTGHRDVFSNGCSAGKLALNALAIPLNFFQFGNLESCMLIPPAWSLGLEMTFYLVAPWILIFSTLRWLSLAASVTVFGAAYIGAIDSDMFGYRLLPGVLFIFLTGAAFEKTDTTSRLIPLAVWTLATATAVFSPPNDQISPMMKEVLLGVIIAIPALAITRRLPRMEVDEFLGNVSYGLFLNHFMIIWVLRHFGYELSSTYFLLLFTASTCLATTSFYLLEKPTIALRRRVRSHLANQSSLPRLSIQPNVLMK
jgi:peptidoglycan/LPS O-acetylase OafA/YrhL